MLDWLKRGAPPATSKANPGQHLQIHCAFTNGVKTWEEEADILRCLADVLKTGGNSCSVRKSWIEVEPGFILQPRLVSLQPLEKGGVQTLTTVEVTNAAGIPAGVFEFQHSTGDDIQASITKGFNSWMEGDLPVFVDALREQPEQCTYLQIEPAAGTGLGKRRVVLGPVGHLVTRPAENEQEEHPFCPCCLFTKTGEIWKEKVDGSDFYGIRLFAMRGPDGSAGADCRVNGEDWDAGKAALIEYVKSWPDRGVEFRKQYIIMQSRPT